MEGRLVQRRTAGSPLAINGISPVVWRSIAVRTPGGLQLNRWSRQPFQSQRERFSALQPPPIEELVLKPEFALGLKQRRARRLWHKKDWLLVLVVLAAGIASALYFLLGIVIIAGFTLYQFCTKRESKLLFMGAFLLSLTMPIFIILQLQKTMVAKNIASYLFVLLGAALIVLLTEKRQIHNEKL